MKSLADERIGQMTNELAQRDENILKLEESVTQKNANIDIVSRQKADILGQKPRKDICDGPFRNGENSNSQEAK